MDESKSLAKNSIYNVIYNLVNVLLPLISSIYVSRILEPTGVGKVAYAITFVSYFVTFSGFGLPAYGVSAISRSKGDADTKNRVFSELILINSISTTVALITYFFLIFRLQFARNDLPLYLCCGIQLMLCYIDIDWLYRGEEEYGYITKRNIFVKTVSLLCVFIFVRTKDDYIKYALISSGALGANYLFNVLYAKKYVRLTYKGLCPSIHLKALLFLSISLFFSSIYSRVDITMLGLMSTETSVGIYSNGHKVINIVITACTAITSVFLPRMSYLYREDKDSFMRLLNKGIRIIALITIPACFGLMLLSQDAILLLYGDSFRAAGSVLRIFSVLIPVKGLGDLLCYQTVISIGKEKSLVPAAGAAMLVNVILNFLLIPVWGEIGATVASVCSEITVNSLMLLYVRKQVNFHIQGKELVKILVSTGAMCVMVGIVKWCRLSNLLTCTISLVVGVTVYVLINMLLGNELIIDLVHMAKKRLRKKK